MTQDSYFRHPVTPREINLNEEPIIPMDNSHTSYSPFISFDEPIDYHRMGMHPESGVGGLNRQTRISDTIPSCPIDTMQKRRIEDLDNSRNYGSKTTSAGTSRDLDRGVAFRGFGGDEQSLKYNNVVDIGGEENFSYRRTMGDGSTTKTPIGDWDFEEDQKRNMNGLVDDIYVEDTNSLYGGGGGGGSGSGGGGGSTSASGSGGQGMCRAKSSNNENGALFLKQFERNTHHPQLKDIKPKKGGQIFESMLLSGNMEASPVSQLFFSKQNLQALQDGIRYSVFNLSEGRHNIGEQSNEELIIIMKTMFLTYGKNLVYNVVEQVRELNKLVLDYAIPEIIEQIEMYEKYRQDKAYLPTPLDRFASTTIKGEKTLEMPRYF